jgi:lipopolysaccharide export system permease protein
MRQIERYVMVELLRVFGVLITISSLLFVFIAAFNEGQKLDLGVGQIIQIIPYLVPSLLPYTIPATLLLSVCVVFGRMAGDSEIIAVRAAGIHLMHLMWPAFFVAATMSVITLILTDQITPWAFRKIEHVIVSAIEDIFLDKLRSENTYRNQEKGITINVLGVEGRTLIEPTIRFTPPGGKPTTITAKTAFIEFDLRRRQVKMTFYEMHGNFGGKNQNGYSKFEKIAYALPNETSDGGIRVLRTQDLLNKLDIQLKTKVEMRQCEAIDVAFALSRGDFDRFCGPSLSHYKHQTDVATNQIRTLRTEYYNRFSMSVSGFFVVLVGTPFSILMAKKQFLTSFLFCFLPILTVYYPIAMMTQNMSKSGQIDPLWSAWIANAVLLIAAGYNIRKVLKN